MDEGTRTEAVQALDDVGRFWWIWLIVGIAWLVIGFIIFQFDTTSVTAVGILIGLMFLVAGLQYVIVGTQAEGWAWLWYAFGALLIIGGLIAMFNPQRTFVSIANILGFIFLLVGVIWLIEAFMAKDFYDLWWLNLIAGILMIALAFWLGNRFFFAKAETLLIFAGVWAMMRGIVDIIGAFRVRRTGKAIDAALGTG